MAMIDIDNWAEEELLTESERQELKNLDSRVFGQPAFSQQPEGVHLKLLLEKAVSELEDKLGNYIGSDLESAEIDSDVFLKLGHYSLLLERFPQALSAYQKYFGSNESSYWKNTAFLYGLAIVYFHFNASHWAIRAFQQILYIDQGFERTKDVHLFLALLFKNTRDFNSSKKHFNTALFDPTESLLLTYPEIKFHESHAEELQGNFTEAKKGYDDILLLDGIDLKTKALVFKQLGWLHETVEEFGPDLNSRIARAVEYYQQSLTSNQEDGEVYYYLGRCHASLGEVQAAFGYYRSAIDKRESCPDTWCSIGVLYQQQGQPSDALQAFICAVQLEEAHTAAWLNLGILYEAESQPRDAYICYHNAASKNKELGEALKSRLEALKAEVMAASQQQKTKLNGNSPNFKGQQPGAMMQGGANPQMGNHKRQLHSIDEAWNLPIPAELTSRRRVKNSKRGNESAMMDISGPPGAGPGLILPSDVTSAGAASGGVGGKRQRMPQSTGDEGQGGDASAATMIQFPPEEMEMMRSLENHLSKTGILSNSQQMRLVQLQQKFQQFTDEQKRRMLMGTSSTASSPSGLGGPSSSSGAPSGVISSAMQQTPSTSSESPLSHGPGTYQAIASDPAIDIKMDTNENAPPYNKPSLDLTDTLNVLHSMVDRKAQSQLVGSSDVEKFARSDSADSQVKPAQETLPPFTEFKLKSSKPTEVPPSIHIHLSPELLKTVQDYDNGENDVDIWQVFNVDLPPPNPPEAPVDVEPEAESTTGASNEPTGIVNNAWLHPPTPTVTVESKREAYSEKLMEYCLLKNQPVTVIKGMTTALKIDLGLFTTKSLCEYNPEHPVEVRNQVNQPPDENWGGLGGPAGSSAAATDYAYQCWPCGSSKSMSTITKYAQYQVSAFLASQQEAATGGNSSSSPSTKNGTSNNHHHHLHPCSSPDLSSADGSPSKGKRGRKQKFKSIKFGTNVDLSDEKKWGPQLQEISKLPIFCRLISAANMLSHLPHTILGMNSVQLYMKVPGCRTPGHQENLNFCSVNINIGPGNCEWFAVDTEYWGVIQRLCERNNTNFLHGSWWPLLQDLEEMRVPVYRFIQKPGDLVFINAGVVHWVQSTGFCNNIAWNVGPLNGYQYSLAVERYEWNKLQNYRSLVPMITLTWNLARNVRVTDENLYLGMKACLIKSLKYNELCLEEVRERIKPEVEVRWHGRQHGELVNFCATCDQEVFNILYTKQQLPSAVTELTDPSISGMNSSALSHNQDHLSSTAAGISVGAAMGAGGGKPQVFVYCRSCALRISSNLLHFVILQEYKIEDLTLILNHFKLKPKESVVDKSSS